MLYPSIALIFAAAGFLQGLTGNYLHQYFRLIFVLLTILGIWLLFSGGRFFFR